MARERQDAWLATGRPNLTQRLTADLSRGYALLRSDRATDPLPQSAADINTCEGNGLERLPYYGKPPAFMRGD